MKNEVRDNWKEFLRSLFLDAINVFIYVYAFLV
jgi:hypothetical protein